MRNNYLLVRVVSVLLGMFLGTAALFAQKTIEATGTVIDGQKVPVAGVAVIQQGTTHGVATDVDGKFSISVPEGAILEISSIGFKTVELPASANMDIVLKEDSEMLNETVVVGYGVQKRESLTGSISQIRSEDIAMTKSANAVASLQGKIPGLMINQNNGQPGSFASDINLRGFGTPMVVVDGVVRSSTKTRKSTSWNNDPTALESYNDLSVLQELNPDDIESISVLKDASATIYGLGAQNGVILITTKKGQVKKPSVNFSAMMNLSQPTTPRNVESWTSYMKWKNAMDDVAKKTHTYTDDVIAAYESGDPNYIYNDWYDAVYKKFAFNQQYNLSVTGGNETVSYYLGGNFTDDNSILKADNYGYKRYSFNGNVQIRLTNDLTARYTTSLRQSTNLAPGDADMAWNIFYYIYQCDPTIGVHPKDNPGHYSDVEEQANPAAIMDSDVSGYTKADNKSFSNTFDLTYEAPFLKGLRLMATGAYDFDRNKTRTLIMMYRLYDYETDAPGGQTRQETQYSELWTDNTRLYGRAQALYDHSFGLHNVSAMLGAELTDNTTAMVNADRKYGADKDNWLYTHDTINSGLQSTAMNSGTRSSTRTAGYIGRVNYNYAGKYLVELMARYDGNYQFKKGKRWGFFPSYSLGWRISEEPFFKKVFPKVNNLKFRWSDGYTGSVQGSPYAYVGGYTSSGSWVFSEGKTTAGYASNTVENSILTWAKVRMMDFGVDWEVWQGKFGGTFDWYKRDIDGIAATRDVSLPDFYAVAIPSENINRYETQGLELSLYHRNNIGQFFYRIQGNVSYARSRYTYIESEGTRNYSSQMAYWYGASLNRWNGYFGGSTYLWDGNQQFTSLADAASSQILYDSSSSGEGNRAIVPGMYKIIDRNGNGYIDSGDVFYTWGNGSNPPLQFGLMLSGNWKALDFSLVFNGSALKYKSYMMGGYSSFGKLNYLPSQYTDSYHVAEYGADPWDPQTQWIAGWWPALASISQSGESHNATYTSSQPYNWIDASYLRLKSVEIGYRFNPAFLQKVGIKGARIFFNGGNLLTICNPLLKYIDPESSDTSWVAGGVYQINKTFNFGVNLNF
ncbi:MAG: TonB-dependent receptor [Bacteroidales bacterium]|nr:TonB-dependent receptor [Bacteroidales bacterium]